MSAFVAVNPKVCTGCRECEVVCSLFHLGESRPSGSAVRVFRLEHDGLVDCVPRVCQQCQDEPCVGSCPTGALTRPSGALSVDAGLCTGCGECTGACPAGCVFVDAATQVAVGCDLCGGEPQCVQFCHCQCLTVGEATTAEAGSRLERLASALAVVTRGVGSGRGGR